MNAKPIGKPSKEMKELYEQVLEYLPELMKERQDKEESKK